MIRVRQEVISFVMVQYAFLTYFHFHTENAKNYKKAVYEIKCI